MNFRKSLLCISAGCLMSTIAHATPMLSFLIDGNTFTQPFSITNSSDAGEFVTRFQLDISPASMVFDTVTGGIPNTTIGVPFTPIGGTGATTGLVGPVVVADGSGLIDIDFIDFNAGEIFSWDIDVDGVSGSPITVTGDLLIGSLATVDFSDGQRLLGVLAAVAGNADASQFTVTGVTVTPSVPEPSIMVLLGLGLVSIGLTRRKHTKRA